MKEKNPCIGCKDEKPLCHRTCSRSIRYQKLKAIEREHAKAERDKEAALATYKFDRIADTKKKLGLD